MKGSTLEPNEQNYIQSSQKEGACTDTMEVIDVITHLSLRAAIRLGLEPLISMLAILTWTDCQKYPWTVLYVANCSMQNK